LQQFHLAEHKRLHKYNESKENSPIMSSLYH